MLHWLVAALAVYLVAGLLVAWRSLAALPLEDRLRFWGRPGRALGRLALVALAWPLWAADVAAALVLWWFLGGD